MSSSKPLENWLVFFNPSDLGELPSTQCLKQIYSGSTFFSLAIDGGIKRAQQLGFSVNWHIGDFDSVPIANHHYNDFDWQKVVGLANQYPDLNQSKQFVLSKNKDFLDGETVFEILRTRNLGQVVFFDFWHGRWDFSLFHFLCLINNNWLKNKLTIILPNGLCFYASGSRIFSGFTDCLFSILPIETMLGVSLKGSQFDGESFTFTPQKGHSLSNRFRNDTLELCMHNQARYLFFIFHDGVS